MVSIAACILNMISKRNHLGDTLSIFIGDKGDPGRDHGIEGDVFRICITLKISYYYIYTFWSGLSNMIHNYQDRVILYLSLLESVVILVDIMVEKGIFSWFVLLYTIPISFYTNFGNSYMIQRLSIWWSFIYLGWSQWWSWWRS